MVMFHFPQFFVNVYQRVLWLYPSTTPAAFQNSHLAHLAPPWSENGALDRPQVLQKLFRPITNMLWSIGIII